MQQYTPLALLRISHETGHDGGNFSPQEIRGNSHKLKTQTLHLCLTLQPESAHAKGLACILWRAGHVSICRLSFPLPCNGFFRQGNGMLRLSVNTDFFFFFSRTGSGPIVKLPVGPIHYKKLNPKRCRALLSIHFQLLCLHFYINVHSHWVLIRLHRKMTGLCEHILLPFLEETLTTACTHSPDCHASVF